MALHRRAIPGSDQVIDHLVIGPAGVFAIDSEQWDKRLQVRTWNGLDIFHGPFSHTERLEHAQWEAAQATRRISNALRHQVLVRPAMVVYGPKVPWTVARILGVDVFAGDRLLKYLRHEARAKAKVAERLDPAQITLIAEAAEQALPPQREAGPAAASPAGRALGWQAGSPTRGDCGGSARLGGRRAPADPSRGDRAGRGGHLASPSATAT